MKKNVSRIVYSLLKYVYHVQVVIKIQEKKITTIALGKASIHYIDFDI